MSSTLHFFNSNNICVRKILVRGADDMAFAEMIGQNLTSLVSVDLGMAVFLGRMTDETGGDRYFPNPKALLRQVEIEVLFD